LVRAPSRPCASPEVPVLGRCITSLVPARADRSSVMRAGLWVVAYVLLMCSPWLVAGVSSWRCGRRRRRGAMPRDVRPFFFRRSREWVREELETTAARLDAIKEAEGVVRDAYSRLGPLYEVPVPSSDSSVVRLAEVIVEAEHARTVTER